MRSFWERFTSRKFLMAVAAALVAFLKVLYPDIPEDAVKYVLYACMGFVAAEGTVDALYAIAKWLAGKRAASKEPAVDPEYPDL
ncbi:MAG: hypothetical protein AB1609_00820 [Bacillota bacterium]